jgi:hypothetical protein
MPSSVPDREKGDPATPEEEDAGATGSSIDRFDVQ